MSYKTYNVYCTRGKLIRTKEGRGQGNEAWVSFHDLPVVKGVDLKEFCVRMLGKPENANVVVKSFGAVHTARPQGDRFFCRTPQTQRQTLEV